jgi:signal transduction histidine kinase
MRNDRNADMKAGRARDAARTPRGLARGLFPFGAALAVQGGFALAVMALDRNNRALPSNLGYVVAVECAGAALFLGLYAFRLARMGRALAAASAAPLEAALPEARGYCARLWKDYSLLEREAARKELAERERDSREELEAFLATVHALKTPATALSLMAERAEREGEALSIPDLRLELDELDRILDRAVGRLRLEDFEQGSRMARVEVADSVRASVRKHRRILIARRISVGISGSFSAETEPYWLAFILDQLISNAAKYASSRLSVTLSPVPGERQGLVEVRDDGPGLDDEDALRAFGRSAMGSASRDSQERGPASSGYGLHLASKAAERLGSRLELEGGGDAAKGASFSFTLPLALDPRDDAQAYSPVR